MNKLDLVASLNQKGFPKEIIEAFSKVNREEFVPEELLKYSYEDEALPIEEGQTLSKPSTIAFMLELLELKPSHIVLEIGSGSGYVLALISSITKDSYLYGVEIKTKAAELARNRLTTRPNIKIFSKDGSHGLPEHAPYDRILVSAYCPNIETLDGLTSQLKEGGIIVAPINETLVQLKRVNGNIEKHEFPGFSFVPLVSEGI